MVSLLVLGISFPIASLVFKSSYLVFHGHVNALIMLRLHFAKFAEKGGLFACL